MNSDRKEFSLNANGKPIASPATCIIDNMEVYYLCLYVYLSLDLFRAKRGYTPVRLTFFRRRRNLFQPVLLA